MNDNNITLAWKLYKEGRSYNLSLKQYNIVDTNVDFYAGKQWRHLPKTPEMNKLPHPVFNILERVGSLFISSLCSSRVSVQLSPMAYYDASGTEDPDGELVKMANAEIDNLLEKFNFDDLVMRALEDGAQTGDYCVHCYFDPDTLPYGAGLRNLYRGEIQMELVDGINVMFGNPNDSRVEYQPYIIIEGRDTVENLREEAERWKKHKELYNGGKGPDNPDEIQIDADNLTFAGIGGQAELTGDENGKATYILLYSKKSEYVTATDADGNILYETETDKDGNPVYETENGRPVLDQYGNPVEKRKEAKEWKTTVHVTKATRTAVIFEDIDTGLSRYPIAWGNWKRQKNQYHGRALVTELIPNQISINKSMAMVMFYMNQMAFPKVIFNADAIPRWNNNIGEAIGVRNIQPGQAVSTIAYSFQPAQVAGDFYRVLDNVIQYTKECMGATDAQMGNVAPENTSAIAILTQNSSVPLEIIRIGLRAWVEDITKILLDMMGTYYNIRPVAFREEFEEIVTGPDGMPIFEPYVDPATGIVVDAGAPKTQIVPRQVMRDFDFRILKDYHLNLRIDVGEAGKYSEAAILQTLTNLRQDGTLTVLQYLERIPDRYIPKKDKLMTEIRENMARGEQPNAGAGAAIQQPGSPMSQSNQSKLPSDIRDRFDSMPNKARGAIEQGLRAL